MKDSRNKGFYRVTRETSKYNKYMKWHVQFYREDMSELSSEWAKTHREADALVDKAKESGERGFPIGEMMSYTTYTEIGSVGEG